MANNLINKVINTFQHIRHHNLVNQDSKIKLLLNLLENLSNDLGIIDLNTQYPNEEDELQFVIDNINYQYLEVAIENDPAYIKSGNKYLYKIRESFEDEFLLVKALIENYDLIIEKSKTNSGSRYNNRKEKAIILIHLISQSVFDTLKKLDTNPKAHRLTHPQQLLLMDRLNLLDTLSKKTSNLKTISSIIAAILNQDEANTRSYLTFGSSLSSTKGNSQTYKYNYKDDTHHNRIVEDILKEHNL